LEPTGNTHPAAALGEIVVTFVEMRKWLELGNFDRYDVRHAWMMFFTQPHQMYQIYTPEERKRLEELYEAVDAWDLTRYTEKELEGMDYKIRQELARQCDIHQSFEDGKEEGMKLGMEKILKVFADTKPGAGLTDAEISIRHAITLEMVQRIRQAMGPHPEGQEPFTST
jgi:phage anti-repressor protein